MRRRRYAGWWGGRRWLRGDFAKVLEGFAGRPKLKGLRHVVQGEPAGFLAGEAFNRGVAALRGTGLVYDLLIFERQLEEAIAFVDRHPRQAFVLDHVGKPRIVEAVMEPWGAKMRELARRENVFCKVSGMVTEADPADWSARQLRPYVEAVMEAFGAGRVMVGSDWPVCLAGVSYAGWFGVLEEFFAGYSASERDGIFGGNAVSVYGL